MELTDNQGFISEVNTKADPARVLELIGFAVDKIQLSPATRAIKAFCPIHQDTKVRSLVVALERNTFQCTLRSCSGHSGGTMVELFARTQNKSELEAATELVTRLAIEVNPQWTQHFSSMAVEQAEKLASDGDVSGALDALERARSLEPLADEPIMAMARVHVAMGDSFQAADGLSLAIEDRLNNGLFRSAEELIAKAVDLLPDSEDIFFLQVKAAEAQGRTAEVVSLLRDLAAAREASGRSQDNEGIFKQLVEMMPDDVDARLDLARFFESRRMIKQALGEIEVAAFLLIRQDRVQEAVPHLERVLKAEPMRHPNRNALVDIYRRIGDKDRAQQLVLDQIGIFLEHQDTYQADQVARRWLEWDPENIEVREALARILQEIEMFPEAAAELLECARILRVRGDQDSEMQFLFRVKFILPEDRKLRLQIVSRLKEIGQAQRAAFELLDYAEVLYSAGENEEADRALEDATKVDPSLDFQIQVAENLVQRGRTEPARDLLLAASRQLELDGQLSVALENVQRALEFAPDDLVVAQARVRLLWKLEDPRAGEVSVLLTPLLVMDGRESAAVTLLKQATESIKEPDSSTRALFYLASELEEQDIAAALYWLLSPKTRVEDPAATFAMAQALVRIDPTNEPVIRDLADLGVRLGRTHDAVKAYVDLSRRLRNRGDIEGALRDLQQAQVLDSKRADILLEQIDLVRDLKGEEAVLGVRREYLLRLKAEERLAPELIVAEYESFLQAHPDDRFVLRELAELRWRLGNHGEATARFRQLLEDAEKRGDLDEIVDIRQVLVRMEPDDPFSNANLALALDEAGEVERALQAYARTAQLYLKMGALELAELQLKRGLELGSDDTNILDLVVQVQKHHGNISAVRDSLWQLAQMLRNAERYDAALARLVELRTLAPELIEPIKALAETQEALNDTIQAVSSYTEFARRIEADGDREGALKIYAHICNNLRHDADALREWSRLAEEFGTDSERLTVYSRTAQAMIESRQWTDARRALSKIEGLVPDGTATAGLREKLGESLVDDPRSAGQELRSAAVGYQVLGKVDDAIRCLRLAIDRYPDDPEACGTLAELLKNRNQAAEAIQLRFAQIRGLLRRGDSDPDVEDLIETTFEEVLTEPEKLISFARSIVDAGRRDLALRLLETALDEIDEDFVQILEATDVDLEITLNSPKLRKARVTALVELGSVSEAAAFCRTASARLRVTGDNAGALDMARSLAGLLPEDPESHAVLGACLKALDMGPEAHQAYRLAADIILRADASTQAAIDYLHLAVEADNTRPDTRAVLSGLLADSGHMQEAAEGFFQTAKIYSQSGDLHRSLECLGQSVRLQPRAVEPLRLLAETSRLKGGYGAALPAYRELIALIRETSTEAQIEKVYREIAGHEEGTTEIREAFADWLSHVAGQMEEGKKEYVRLAQACGKVPQNWAKAIHYYTIATTIQPDDQDAYLFEMISAIHLNRQAHDFSAEALREASRLHEMGFRLPEAISSMEKVLALPNGVSTLDDYLRLGSLQRVAGDMNQALATYRLAREQASQMTSNRLREITGVLLELDPSDEQAALDYLDVLPDQQIDRKAVSLARSFMLSGNIEAYERMIAKALSRVPDSLALRLEKVAARSAGTLTDHERQELGQELREVYQFALEQGQRDVAIDAIRHIENLGPLAMPVHDQAELCLKIGNRDKALSILIKTAEDSLRENLNLAVSCITFAAEIDADGIPAPLVAGLVRSGGGRADVRTVAERVLEGALLTRSRNRSLDIVAALLEQSDSKICQSLMRRVLGAAGPSIAVAATKSHCVWLEKHGRMADAFEVANNLSALASGNPESWHLLAQIQQRNSMAADAASSHLKAARLYHESGAIAEEEVCLLEALDSVPEDLEILEALANFYQREQRLQDAAVVGLRIVNRSLAGEDYELAAGWLRKAVSLAPADLAVRERYVDVLLCLNKVDEALDQLLELAKLHIKSNHPNKAATVYQKVFDLEPLNETAIAFLLERATRDNNEKKVIEFTLALAQVRAESNAVSQALQAVRSLQSRFPENLFVLEAVAKMADRAKDHALFRSTSLVLGRIYLEKNDPLTALGHFDNLLSVDAYDPTVLEAAVRTCIQGGLLERAADFSMRLAPIARDRGDAERLLLAGQTLITYDPKRASAHLAMAEAYHWLEDLENALIEFQRAADLYVAVNQPQEAVEALRRVVTLAPSIIGPRKQLAQCLRTTGARDEARRVWMDVYHSLESKPDNATADEAIRAILELAGDDPTAHELAYRYFKSQKNVSDSLDQILHLVRIYVRTGRAEAAEAILEEGLALDPNSLTLQLAALEITRSVGRSDELVMRLEELADRFIAVGDLVLAADVIEQALREDPNIINLRQQLARICLTLGQDGRGILLANEFVNALLATGETEQAREFAENVLAEFSETPGLAAELGDTFLKFFLHDLGARFLVMEASRSGLALEGRIRLLERAVKARPRWADALRQLADAQTAVGDNHAAVGTLDRLTTILVEAKMFSEAINIIQRQINLRPKDVPPRRRLVEIFGRIGDKEQKAESVQSLIDLFVSLGRIDEAVDAYRELNQLRPNDPVLLSRFVELFAQVGNDLEIIDEYVKLAEAYTKQDSLLEATQTYEQALAIDRKNVDVREKFVQFLLDHGQRPRAIVEMRRLAETHMRRGNRAVVLAVLQKAQAINPRDAETALRIVATQEVVEELAEADKAMALASALVEEHPIDQGIETIREVLGAYPQSLLLRRKLVDMLLSTDRREEAATEARLAAELACSAGDFDHAESLYRTVSDFVSESANDLREAIQRHAYDPNLQYMDLIRLGDWLAYRGYPEKALDEYRRARALVDDRPSLIQRCIDAILQFQPEDEAIPDYLLLAERHLSLGQYTRSRKAYEHVLKLDSSNAQARAGRTLTIRAESEGRTGTGTGSGSTRRRITSNHVLNAARNTGKSRVEMGELLDAFTEKKDS
jgi:tetratricopeptide (TPR) repeat protein